MNFNSKKKEIYFVSIINFIIYISQGVYDVPKALSVGRG